MKKIITIALLSTSFVTHAQRMPVHTGFICSMLHVKRVIAIAEKHSVYDKNRHCSVSCMLALKCSADEVLMVGALKEIKDFLGPGEASAADFRADALGVNLATTRAARTDNQCLAQCDNYYHSADSSDGDH